MKKNLLALFLVLASLAHADKPAPFPYANDQWAIDWSDHEIYRGLCAHGFVGAAGGLVVLLGTAADDVPMWGKMTMAFVGVESVNSLYEIYTNKPGGYFLLMDAHAGIVACTTVAVGQLLIELAEKRLKRKYHITAWESGRGTLGLQTSLHFSLGGSGGHQN